MRRNWQSSHRTPCGGTRRRTTSAPWMAPPPKNGSATEPTQRRRPVKSRRRAERYGWVERRQEATGLGFDAFTTVGVRPNSVLPRRQELRRECGVRSLLTAGWRHPFPTSTQPAIALNPMAGENFNTLQSRSMRKVMPVGGSHRSKRKSGRKCCNWGNHRPAGR